MLSQSLFYSQTIIVPGNIIRCFLSRYILLNWGNTKRILVVIYYKIITIAITQLL